MTKRPAILIAIALLLGLSFSACDVITPLVGSLGESASTTADESAASPAITVEGSEETPPAEVAGSTGETPPEDTPTVVPTEPPPMPAFPLSADLFYLNDAGQVWRQPLLGDASAASLVTRLDLTVIDFAVAPGGRWLIYRTRDEVAITSADGLNVQFIAEKVGVPELAPHGQSVTWSRDASKMAFVTETGFQVFIPGAGEEFEPLIFDVPESALADLRWSPDARWLLVGRLDGTAALYSAEAGVALWVEMGPLNGYTWLGDGRLAFTPAEGGLALVIPDDLDSREFIVPQERDVTLPVQRPDGSLAFFVHPEGVERPGYLHIWEPDGAFRQESAVGVMTGSWEWSADGMRLVRAGDDPETITLLDPLTGSVASFASSGQATRFGWGDLPPERVAGLPLPSNLYFLAPQAGIVQVWRLPANGDPPITITDASSDVLSYSISNDGARLAYFTADGMLYFAQLGTEVLVPVIDLSEAGVPAGDPAFSPDGQKLAYANRGIWIADLLTYDKRRLVANILPGEGRPETQVQLHEEPQWSPDGAWLLIKVSFYEGYDFALLPTESPIAVDPILLDLYNSQAEWTQDGLIMVYGAGGGYSPPHLSLVQPGESPGVSHLLSLPILDAALRPDRRIGLLRIPSPTALGPTSVQLYSALADGSDLKVESSPFVLDTPRLSPDGVLVAGLYGARPDEFGEIRGQLALVNSSTGETFVIEGVVGAHDLQWGR